MDTKELINLWGYANLRRWLREDLDEVGIPERSKQFLVEVGLPKNEDWTLKFDLPPPGFVQLANNPTWWQIGWDDPVPICLDEVSGGAVIADASDGALPMFVNSSVEQFGMCLGLYERYRRATRDVAEDARLTAVARLESEVQRVDPEAVTSNANYWPLIIEQLNDGLL